MSHVPRTTGGKRSHKHCLSHKDLAAGMTKQLLWMYQLENKAVLITDQDLMRSSSPILLKTLGPGSSGHWHREL